MTIPTELMNASRPVLFHTDVEGHEVATSGGTLFLIVRNARAYALTAKHNLHDFAWRDLVVTDTRLGRRGARISSVSYPTDGTCAAEGSDLMDLAIVQFAPEISVDFFGGQTFELSDKAVSHSQSGDDLVAYGSLTEFSGINERKVRPTFAELGFLDVGPHKHDPVLREGMAQFRDHPMTQLEGLSGGPVYNVSKGGLVGMVLRGGLRADGSANILYMDISDILRVLQTVENGELRGYYQKTITRQER